MVNVSPPESNALQLQLIGDADVCCGAGAVMTGWLAIATELGVNYASQYGAGLKEMVENFTKPTARV